MTFPRVCSMEHDSSACNDAQVGGSNSIHFIVISVTFFLFMLSRMLLIGRVSRYIYHFALVTCRLPTAAVV